MKRRTIQALAKPGETWVQTLARVHHEAYLVEAFGYERSGLAPQEFLALVNAGVLKPPSQTEPPPNAFEVVLRAGDAHGRDSIKDVRAWDTFEWKTFLAHQDVARKKAEKEHDAIVDLSGVMEHQQSGGRLPPPRRPNLRARQRHAYNQALDRAGIYCRALGAEVADDLSGSRKEVWEGDKIVRENNAAVRARRLRIIQENTARAVQEKWTPEQLADALETLVDGYTRDWLRVARTELQNVFNDGVFLGGIEQHGVSTRFAKIPETSACHYCLDLYLKDGKPIVEPAQWWLANGNNVGKPRGAWKAVISTMHPACMCGLYSVPPGYTITRDAKLKKIRT